MEAKTSFPVSDNRSESFARTSHFSKSCEQAINEQINIEYNISYICECARVCPVRAIYLFSNLTHHRSGAQQELSTRHEPPWWRLSTRHDPPRWRLQPPPLSWLCVLFVMPARGYVCLHLFSHSNHPTFNILPQTTPCTRTLHATMFTCRASPSESSHLPQTQNPKPKTQNPLP